MNTHTQISADKTQKQHIFTMKADSGHPRESRLDVIQTETPLGLWCPDSFCTSIKRQAFPLTHCFHKHKFSHPNSCQINTSPKTFHTVTTVWSHKRIYTFIYSLESKNKTCFSLPVYLCSINIILPVNTTARKSQQICKDLPESVKLYICVRVL